MRPKMSHSIEMVSINYRHGGKRPLVTNGNDIVQEILRGLLQKFRGSIEVTNKFELMVLSFSKIFFFDVNTFSIVSALSNLKHVKLY